MKSKGSWMNASATEEAACLNIGRRGVGVLGLLVGMICMLAVAAVPAAAAEQQAHAFDASLSLTGSCAVSELDTVADPGLCPMPPGEPGVDHPSQPFNRSAGIATDEYGNIYVSNPGPEGQHEGHIDIFDSSGDFITEIEDPEAPQTLAVDSEGNLYVANHVALLDGGENFPLVRFEPDAPYEPAAGNIAYSSAPIPILGIDRDQFHGLALNPLNDQLFVKFTTSVGLYKSAAEGNGLIENFPAGTTSNVESLGLALDAARGRLYVSGYDGPDCLCIHVRKLSSPHDVLFTISSSAVPGGKFLNQVSLAADEGTGHLLAYDAPASKVYEFDQNGNYLTTIQHGFENVYGSVIGLDNGKHSPNGALNPRGRTLFVPSGSGGKGGSTGHSYAFGPPSTCPPEVKAPSAAHVAEAEAELRASVEPCGLQTHYVVEYTSQSRYEEEGNSFEGGAVAGEGEIPAESVPVWINAAATDLEPGTAYRFRVLATNTEGSGEAEGSFSTYSAVEASPPCPNGALRVGLSTLLPDCRAYELVTPADTGGHSPLGLGHLGMYFSTRHASPDGEKVTFHLEGGGIPGFEGTGSLQGDPYRATRGPQGWSTIAVGANGGESLNLLPGSPSADQGYSFWSTGGPQGSASLEGADTTYVRYPDGHSELIGRGSIGTDPRAQGKLISEGGGHVIFVSSNFGTAPHHPAVRLEPDAPPGGTEAVYDRTGDGVTHVVSLLPGDVTPAAGENATFDGASLDGRGIAFDIGGTLYLRHEDSQTFAIGKGADFQGITEGGARIFYLKGGDLYAFDAQTEGTLRFTETGDIASVNVAAGGRVAYFASPTALATEPNPRNVLPVPGDENLYRSEEGSISFVGTVTDGDVEGVAGNDQFGGLGKWAAAAGGVAAPASDPSRSTADGSVLLFESAADLTGFDPEGHREIYRYDADGETLACVSCSPTGLKAGGDASLQSISQGLGDLRPLTNNDTAVNLSAGGRRAVFQSPEALVAADTDGIQDVYEWEEDGMGSCRTGGGCVYLISSGESAHPNYLYGMSEDGNDVFFTTTDLLLPSLDPDETPSIYDARVNGGFPPPSEIAGDCLGEACQPAAVAPNDPTPASSSFEGAGNVTGKAKARGCPRSKRAVKSRGKRRCVARRHHHKRASSERRAHR
jgi:hypothetical protein